MKKHIFYHVAAEVLDKETGTRIKIPRKDFMGNWTLPKKSRDYIPMRIWYVSKEENGELTRVLFCTDKGRGITLSEDDPDEEVRQLYRKYMRDFADVEKEIIEDPFDPEEIVSLAGGWKE